jgi:hypothetical protein
MSETLYDGQPWFKHEQHRFNDLLSFS